MRLIDADALMEHAMRDRLDSRERIMEMIEYAPTVQPKRGMWINRHYIRDNKDYKVCSCCAYVCMGWDGETGVTYDYCPNCGAEMRNGNTNRNKKARKSAK